VDGFSLLVLGGLLAFVGVFWYIGTRSPVSGAEVLHWRPTRSMEDEVRLEMEDIDQMLEAQNERRRRSGRPELTEDEMRSAVAREEAEQEERAARYKSERGGEPEV
jgi:NH3-dependent NAD+ synthetase